MMQKDIILSISVALLVFCLSANVKGSALPGDINGDNGVTWEDLRLLHLSWLGSDCNDSLDADCDVDFADYAILAQDWLKILPEFGGVSYGVFYYVATDGNDANPGTSALPWRTIQKAADTMVLGDTVIVRPGTYNEKVTAVNSGSSRGCGIGDSPITYLADPSGDVIVNAAGNNCGFIIEDKVWIIIDGFKITGSDEDGVKINVDGPGYVTVRNCQIYGNSDDGIEVLERDKVTIESCLFYGNVGAGIRSIYTCSNLQINKCVMYGNDYGLVLSGTSTIKNSIITNNTTEGVNAEAASTITYCDVWNNTTNYTGGISAGAGCISSNPLFVNPPTDFHLSTGSPCIGTGSDGKNMGYRHAPMANAGLDNTFYVNQLAAFDGSASRGNIVSYIWNFNDGGSASGKLVAHPFTTAGTYTVSLTVSDGSASDVDTCTIEVLPAKPPETVYHVTNLQDYNPYTETRISGSLRDRIILAETDGTASRIVFDVNGTIYAHRAIEVNSPNVTICGTEAPGDGITIDFGGGAGDHTGGYSGFLIANNGCRLCNLHITQTTSLPNHTGTDGVDIISNNNVVERCTFTWCRDEGIHVGYGYGNIVAYNCFAFCGSQTGDGSDDDDGRGIMVAEGAQAIVVGNYIGDNLRGVLHQGHVTYTTGFMDFRNNVVSHNHRTYGLNVQTVNSYANFINNIIDNNGGQGIRYMANSTFYRGSPNTNILINNNEDYTSPYTEVFTPMNRDATTPYPNWLQDADTPPERYPTIYPNISSVGMGSGKCQCVLCEHAGH